MGALCWTAEAAKAYQALRPSRVSASIWPVLCVLNKVEDQLVLGTEPQAAGSGNWAW